MSVFAMQIQGVRPSYRPGEIVSGTIECRVGQPKGPMEIRLFWFTTGRAPMQIGMIEIRTESQAGPEEPCHFEFVLPEGPWSVRGMLMGLDWAVEAIAAATGEHTRAVFSVGPGDGAIQLVEID